MRYTHTSFLLVVPGCTIMGYGVGMLFASMIHYSMIGFGAMLLALGLVVALTD